MGDVNAPGRVFSASVRADQFQALFGDAQSPVLVFDFAIYLDCSLPRETRSLVVVETATARIVSTADKVLSGLADAVGEGRHRIEGDTYRLAAAAARERVDRRLPFLVAKVKSAIDEERHRRRRRLDTVFDLRLADAESGEGEEKSEEVARLLEEKRRAVAHAEAHYDPESLAVLAEVELVLLVGVKP